MLCVLFFLYLISGALTQDPELAELDEDDINAELYNYTCSVPPGDLIRNGRFRVEGYSDDEQPRVGKKHYSFVLQVFCNPGFTMKGWFLVACYTDTGTDELPECLPTCKRSSPEVFSCGSSFGNNEAQCIVPNDGIATRSRPELQCGVTPKFIKTAVVNGREANREEVPWHAGVYTKTTRPYMQICGATIVSNNVVVSAAHCFWSDIEKKLPAENYAVAVGKLYRPWNETNDRDAQKFDVQEIRTPPRYQGSATNFQDDIALVILGAPFVIKFTSLITPACLDFNFDFDARQLTEGKLGRVAGWGLDSEDGPSSQLLNVVELPIVGIDQCIAEAEPGFLPSITSDKICAGYTNGTAVCKGDSGGGLVVPEVVGETTRYFLRGIISTAPRSDHLCNIYAVATFTHVFKHEHFIIEAISQTPLINEAPKKAPIPTTFPTITEDTTRAANDENRNVDLISENTDTLLTDDDINTEGNTKNTLSIAIINEDDTVIEDTTKNLPNTFISIVEDTEKVADLSVEDNKNNVETNMKNNDFNELLNQDISPLPLTNLNSSNSKGNRNNSVTIFNPDKDSPKTDAGLAKTPNINDEVVVKVGFEPITNPPLKINDNFDEIIKELDTNQKGNVEEVNIGVNANQNPITDTIEESSENIGSDSSGNLNDNIAITPASGAPIGISTGQTFEIGNANENLGFLPSDNESSIDINAASGNANDQEANIPSAAEVIKVNQGQLLQTVNPIVPTPIEINVGTINSNERPVTAKEASINGDSVTIWPTITPAVIPIGADNIGSTNSGVEYTQTTSILEDHWVTVGPDIDHDTPGHFHHHWPYHSWQKQPSGQNSYQNLHKPPNGQYSHHNWHNQPSWQSSHQHNWQNQPNWHNWNPTNWQQKRFHPFVEYHQGFSKLPSKPASNYGPWFSRFKK